MFSFDKSSCSEKLEHQMAASSAAGREALAVMERVSRSLSGAQKVAKAFELTEMSRQFMLAGIRVTHPEASDAVIRALYVDRLLSYHGTSLALLRGVSQVANDPKEAQS